MQYVIPPAPIYHGPGRLGSPLTPVSPDRFHGFTENSREVNMDMKEMVDKVKKGEPLYGSSQVSTYLQGVAARNSRYANLFVQVIPWFNLVNHEHVSFVYFPSLWSATNLQNTDYHTSMVSIRLNTISRLSGSLRLNAFPRLDLLENHVVRKGGFIALLGGCYFRSMRCVRKLKM